MNGIRRRTCHWGYNSLIDFTRLVYNFLGRTSQTCCISHIIRCESYLLKPVLKSSTGIDKCDSQQIGPSIRFYDGERTKDGVGLQEIRNAFSFSTFIIL